MPTLIRTDCSRDRRAALAEGRGLELVARRMAIELEPALLGRLREAIRLKQNFIADGHILLGGGNDNTNVGFENIGLDGQAGGPPVDVYATAAMAFETAPVPPRDLTPASASLRASA